MKTAKLEAMWYLVLTQRSQILQAREDNTVDSAKPNNTGSSGKANNTGSKILALARSQQAFA